MGTVGPTNGQALPNRRALYNKVLGMLVGSAIGDAMGAPTEMWTRDAIALDYGFVNRLDTMVREPSPEGTWLYNLPAGGTTDDTRWKVLAINYLLAQKKKNLAPKEFAQHILTQYQISIQRLKKTEGLAPEPYEARSREMAWLQEWAKVAQPFIANDLVSYSNALSRFYGGEVTCAGMLYAPAIGGFYPGNPELAYTQTYAISVFDLGYARDISGLTAAMVSAAMAPNATPEAILNVLRDVDPEHYFQSRLVGRSAHRILKQARTIVAEANKIQQADRKSLTIPLPKRGPVDTLMLTRMQKAYELLEAQNQDLPFHAAEIHLVNLTALLFSNFDFEKALAFVINYGRDNDTTGAVTGAILGAYWGADRLPKAMVTKVITVNKQRLGTDLEALADKLTDRILLK
ncbi:ADP-ribosylglycohydrolase family protein [Spirosoma taeanense]|uniref:ADP-ribosylglycohydrolase family protein n=1 Tax=Spirosoma taeanense TaxID=2735870 RepID=A0A6M5Y8J1_9BACT|nr:ADP-ribosylglycohydrolase family protein [Spirosoma taeanense]QJW90607.1 ADP-ribosylglycohydrolase family protein [Spirosoma taeanense]